MSNTERTERIKTRNTSIRREFKKMTDEKHLDIDWTLGQLAKNFHLSSRTIWKIVARQDVYKDL
jgi:hypothetical protein